MTYPTFQKLILLWKNSINPPWQFTNQTLEMWYEEYFQYYSEDKFRKVILYLSEEGKEVNLKNLLLAIKETFGYLMHEEISKAERIRECKKEKKDYSNLPLPCQEAVDYLTKNRRK